MCGIIGLFNSKDVEKKLKKGLKEMQNRGKDASHISVKSNNGIGHNLHAIVNIVPQPIKNKFVTNCEIYNWKELSEKYKLKTKNDAETIFKIIEKHGIKKIEEFDGVFAFSYWDKDNLILARDLIGIKPIWYSHSKEFAFASEKKVLEKLGYQDVVELNPRKILTYNIKENKITFKERKFFDITPELSNYKKIKEELKKKLIDSVTKRITEKKVGVLFSGGIDSTIICHILKDLKVDFTCYTAALDEKSMTKAEDLIYAEKIAKQYNYKLKSKLIKLKDIPKYLETIVPLIEDTNVVKVGVALPFYISCELAKKDNVKVIFSGLGSEEIFAGYERHENSKNLNEECVYGLKQIYQRDLYRDDVVTMYNTMELRVPFLDKELVKFSLRIPQKYKIKKGIKKYVLREISEELGLDHEYAFRKKKAAQYGSKFDKALMKLSKKKGKTKSEYLREFYPSHNLRIGALLSSGKDSVYAIYLMRKMNYDISCCITMISENQDSYMFHTPNVHLVDLQAESMQIPLVKVITKGEKEKELQDLKKAIKIAKDKYKLDGIVTGALFSTYQRNRVEKICDELGLKAFAPLWHKDQEELMREVLNVNFRFIFSSIAGDGLDKTWLNKEITMEHVYKLIEINKKIGTNIAGEGGEFETFVYDGPIFQKKIKIKKSSIAMESECTGRLDIQDAELIDKKRA